MGLPVASRVTVTVTVSSSGTISASNGIARRAGREPSPKRLP